MHLGASGIMRATEKQRNQSFHGQQCGQYTTFGVPPIHLIHVHMIQKNTILTALELPSAHAFCSEEMLSILLIGHDLE